MTDLKIGDKVLTLPGKLHDNSCPGAVGIIIEIRKYSTYRYAVQFGSEHNIFCPEHLKKVPKCKKITDMFGKIK